MTHTHLQTQRLWESAAHWLEIWQDPQAAYKQETYYSSGCPCCNEWYDSSPECKGCPIHQYTGHDDCLGTPYRKARNEIETYSPGPAITAEYRFLVTLALGEDPNQETHS